MYKIMKKVKKHIQNKYIRNALILQNWKDIRIADIPIAMLYEIDEGGLFN